MKRRGRMAAVMGLALAACLAGAAGAGPVEDGNAGMDALNAGDNDTAIRKFTSALASKALSPDDQALAYTERGLAYLRKHQFAPAKADLHHALALKPDDDKAGRYLTLADQGRSDTEAPARQAAATPPAAAAPPAAASAPTTHRNMLGVLGRAMAESAKQSLCQQFAGTNCPADVAAVQGAPDATPPPPHPHTPSMDDGAKGMAALDRGQYELAIRYFNRAINARDLAPEDLELAYFSRAKAYYKLGAEPQALSDLSQALRLSPTNSDAQAAFAQVVSGHRHGPALDAPQDLATCTANFKASGSFLKGRVYVAWADYPQLSPLDAFAGAFNASPANQWTVTKADFDYGTIDATQAIPGSPRTLAISMKVEPLNRGSRTTITVQVEPLLMVTDMKTNLCRVLAALPS